MNFHKIVLTGGPCAGKTTALSWIQNAFQERGYTVVIVPETATELIPSGLAPWTTGRNIDYQKCEVELQLTKERIYERGARSMNADKILLVCDRGIMDDKAYMTAEEFEEVLQFTGVSEIEIRDGYDAVFHMVTAAKGAEEFYTCGNNTARTETPEEAAALDDANIAAWTGHPHFRIIDNSTDFETKLKRTIAEIAAFLGEPEPLEIERKYLIEYPDMQWLESLKCCCRVEIIQTYLKAEKDEEIRVRQRGMDGHYVYYETIKRPVDGLTRVEIERRLTQAEYLEKLMHADTTLRQIRKTRYCITYDNQSFELDIYPFWKDRAILEIEVSSPEDEVRFPEGFKVIKEVTYDDLYKNSSIAKEL